MTTQSAPQLSLAELAGELRRSSENQARFERAYTLARGKFDERQGIIAKSVLDNGDAIRAVRTELLVVSQAVDETRQIALKAVGVGEATQKTVTELDTWMRARFATEDEEKGKLIAEIARLDNADAVAEQRDDKVGEEITSMHRRQEAARAALEAQQKRHDEAVARAEQDRARGTLKVGIATALPAALFSFLKEHPTAFETAWKAIGTLFGGP